MTGARARIRRLSMGLGTLLGPRPLGFFIPYRYAAAVVPGVYPAVASKLAAAIPAFDQVLAQIEAFAGQLEALRGPAPIPRFDQDWFPRLDAAAAYAMVMQCRPARIVEIGSGHSTRFLARACADAGLATRLTCIDPAPRASLAGLPIDWQSCTLQAAPPGIFTGLQAGDLLFVDSSHILMPGTDVDWVLNRVLPGLAAGVVIHVHDVFLPDPYPRSWAWRGYNEQQAVAPLLMGGDYRLRFASHYVATRMRERLTQGILARLPVPKGPESSLWLEKVRPGDGG